ncbi:MAG: relaxase/mobilization nuclease domain-containing protein [Christensenella sp.]
MATTAIWDVRKRLDHVLTYAENPEKTRNPKWGNEQIKSMEDVMEYAMRQAQERGLADVLNYATEDFKTEEKFFVTGLNCAKETARWDMELTKRQWHKEGGIIAFHGYQSFAKGEVTPELAHKIGVELAKRLWGERFEVIVSTHLNTKCLHNHFVINSVSFQDGKRYYDNKKNYALMQRISDELCRAHSLSVIAEKKGRRKHYAQWQAENEGKPTWRSAIRDDVDKAVMQVMSFPAFLRALKDMGYEVKTNVKYIAIRPPQKERFIRLRSMGEQYTEDAIRARILRQNVPQFAEQPKRPAQARYNGTFILLRRITWKGLRALYYYYLHKLRQTTQTKYAPYLLREDLRYLDTISKQAKFLNKYGIDTAAALNERKAVVQMQICSLVSKRTQLKNEQRRREIPATRKEEISKQLKELSTQVASFRREGKLCEDILARSVKLSEKVKQLRNEQESEVKKNEPFRRRGGSDRQHDGARR